MEEEDLIKLRLEYLSKNKLIMHLVVFLLAFVSCLVAAPYTPELFNYSTAIVDECDPTNRDISCFTANGNKQV